MASQIIGYEYDVFISYRHKDNKYDGWVSEFVANLKKELEATFKEDVSVYFDDNADDGLKESHDVDDSLKSKLNCLVFIPIISQTYCDPKSFAWQHELLYFKQHASADKLGLKVKVANTNVASRILPVKIHDIDQGDKDMLEHQLGGFVRSIDFIFKSSGVNRPLRPKDDEVPSESHVLYRNQINKVANSIKEVIVGLKGKEDIKQPGEVSVQSIRNTGQLATVSSKTKQRLAYLSIALIILALLCYGAYAFLRPDATVPASERSIAVLPFENMSKDPEQDYFSSGMTEDILNHLSKVADLQVKSRTSTLQYKGTVKTIREIGSELGVINVVEGSVRRVGDKVRIVVQLIDAEKDIHLWSETYDRDLKDVFSVQSEIAIEIANTLEARLTVAEKNDIQKEQTQDITAYDFYLRAREELYSITYSKSELNRLKDLVDEAIRIDPDFAKAYALKARLWFELSLFGLSEKLWTDSCRANADMAIALDPNAPDGYWIKAAVDDFLGDFKNFEENLSKAYTLNPNDPDTRSYYGWHLLNKGDEAGADLILKSVNEGYTSKQSGFYAGMISPYYLAGDYENALKILSRLSEISPNSDIPHMWAARIYIDLNQLDKAQAESETLLKRNPGLPNNTDQAAWIAFLNKDYIKAAEYWGKYKEFEERFEDKSQTIPFRHRKAMALLKLGQTDEAKRLLKEEEKIQQEMINKTRGTGAWGNRGALFYDLAVSQALFGKNESAIQNLDSAFKYKLFLKHLYGNDPAFEHIKDLPSFKKVQTKVDEFYSFRKKAFINAFARAKANTDLKNFKGR